MNSDYAKMYAILCAAASQAIDLIDRGESREAAAQLQTALECAEEIFIQSKPGFKDRFHGLVHGFQNILRMTWPYILPFLAACIVLFAGFVLGGVFVLRWG